MCLSKRIPRYVVFNHRSLRWQSLPAPGTGLRNRDWGACPQYGIWGHAPPRKIIEGAKNREKREISSAEGAKNSITP